MSKLILALSLALAATSAAAQPINHSGHMQMTTTPATATGQGTIRKIDPKAGSVTLQHAPIPALSWPAMTMPFKASAELLKSFKVGQKVTFSVTSGSPPEITAMTAQ